VAIFLEFSQSGKNRRLWDRRVTHFMISHCQTLRDKKTARNYKRRATVSVGRCLLFICTRLLSYKRSYRIALCSNC